MLNIALFLENTAIRAQHVVLGRNLLISQLFSIASLSGRWEKTTRKILPRAEQRQKAMQKGKQEVEKVFSQ